MSWKTGTKLGVVAAALLGITGAGLAVAEPLEGAPVGGKRQARMLEKFDTNKNGVLEDSERQAAFEQKRAKREARRQEALQKFDANKDGQLDEAERKKLFEERTTARFQALDANRDGQLSLAEFQAGMGKGRHGRRGFGGMKR